MTELLFVYGTLMDPLIQKQVFGRTVPGQPDTLAGYKKHSVRLDTGTYPIIKPEPDGLVEGLVLQMTPAELALSDQYEGEAYRRKMVTLTSGRRAWVYQA